MQSTGDLDPPCLQQKCILAMFKNRNVEKKKFIFLIYSSKFNVYVLNPGETHEGSIEDRKVKVFSKDSLVLQAVSYGSK